MLKVSVVENVTASKAFASVLPLVLLTPALFAVNMLMARWAESAGIPPFLLAFGRWSLAVILLLPWVLPCLRAWAPAIRANWRRFSLLAVLGMAVAVGPQYVGARTTSAANMALIFSVCPAIVGVIEVLGWKASFSHRRWWGLLISLAGVIVVLTRGDVSAWNGMRFCGGDVWVLLAALGWAFYTVLGKRFALPPVPALVRLFVLAAGGALALAPFALVESCTGLRADFSDPRLYYALAVLAVVPSLCAYLCYERLLASVGTVGASVSMYLVPLYASLAAWPLLGEIPRWHQALGFFLVLAGMLVSEWQGPRGFLLRIRGGQGSLALDRSLRVQP